MDSIATTLGRTSSALDLRLKKIIYDNMTAGKSPESLSALMHIPVDKIQQYYYEYKGFLEKKAKINPAEAKPVQVSAPVTQPTPVQNNIPKPPIFQPTTIIQPPHIIRPSADQQIIIQPKPGNHMTQQNLILAGGVKEKLHEKPKENMENKIKRLEVENGHIKTILDNVEMRKKLNKLIKSGTIDSKFKKLLK